MYFYPLHRAEFYSVLEQIRAKAVAEAEMIAAARKLKMRVDRTKPVDFDLADYKIPTGNVTYTFKSNVAFFPAGFFSNDSSFDYIQWWKGKGTIWVGEMFTRDIYYTQERQGIYAGNMSHYEFRGAETFRHNAHSTTGLTSVDAWFIAFTVRPETMAETKIIETP
jgi:hypothetical protein